MFLEALGRLLKKDQLGKLKTEFRFHPCNSRAWPLDLFEQPATRVFQQPTGEIDLIETMQNATTVSMQSGGNIVQHAAA